MFDPVLKSIADRFQPDLLAFLRGQLGLPATGKVTVVQPNLPKKTIDADRVYRLSSPSPMLIHTEWESGTELGRPSRFLLYNTLLWDQTKLPVKTVVVLLRKEANSTDLTGVLTRTLPDAQEYLVWRYSVIRLWELPPDLFLASPGLTPLAPFGGGFRGGSAVAGQTDATNLVQPPGIPDQGVEVSG